MVHSLKMHQLQEKNNRALQKNKTQHKASVTKLSNSYLIENFFIYRCEKKQEVTEEHLHWAKEQGVWKVHLFQLQQSRRRVHAGFCHQRLHNLKTDETEHGVDPVSEWSYGVRVKGAQRQAQGVGKLHTMQWNSKVENTWFGFCFFSFTFSCRTQKALQLVVVVWESELLCLYCVYKKEERFCFL